MQLFDMKKIYSKMCLQCMKVFFKGSNRSVKTWLEVAVYCSRSCRARANIINLLPATFTKEKFLLKSNHPRWKGGISKMKGYSKPYGIAYKARKKGAIGEFTSQEWEKLKRKYNHMCLCCKQQEPFIKLTVDHVMPLAMGGSNYIENIQPLCGSCNSRKQKTVRDYRDSRTLYAII